MTHGKIVVLRGEKRMKRSHAVGILFSLLVAALLAAGPIWAQVNAVDLSGTVTDQTGAVVNGAKVTVKNLATNATRTVESREDGNYRFTSLAPGRYEMKVQMSGFAPYTNTEFALEIGRVPELNVQLQPATVAQSTTVTGEAELVETQRT